MLELDHKTGLPSATEVSALVGHDVGVSIGPYLDEALLAAAVDLASRPSKKFRARLVELSYALCQKSGTLPDEATTERLRLCAQAIELMHAGSLIVDDIQDGSTVRRGSETIHRRFGMPGALCTGNWLYFWPLRLLRQLGLPLAAEHRAVSVYLDALEKAHYGQALDLRLRAEALPRRELDGLARAITDLKTGAITSLAMELGAILAGVDETAATAVAAFGRRFGAALQHLDDLGNLVSQDAAEKRYEDLLQSKVTAVWAFVATLTSDGEFSRFAAAVQALRSGDTAPVNAWLEESDFLARVGAEVRTDLDSAFATLGLELDLPLEHPAMSELRHLAESLLHAYV